MIWLLRRFVPIGDLLTLIVVLALVQMTGVFDLVGYGLGLLPDWMNWL